MKPHILFLSVLSLFISSCKDGTKTSQDTAQHKGQNIIENLKTSLTLYASFDETAEADFARGDKQIYSVTNRKAIDSAKVGIHKESVSLSKDKGKQGGSLSFADKTKGYIYYKSLNNIAYSKVDWSGSISFWLSLTPNEDLKPGYCDPIQITDSGYNDAGIWVDYTKENPRDFRLGVIGDRVSWNPKPNGPDNENPNFISQLIPLKNPPFSKDRWTHIVINFEHLNTDNAKAALFVDNTKVGERDIKDPFTWEVEKSNIFLGLSYIGHMDELSIYNRTLNTSEIDALYTLEDRLID